MSRWPIFGSVMRNCRVSTFQPNWCRWPSTNFRSCLWPPPVHAGRTVLRGAEELRVKESDRIDAMAIGLQSLGVQVETWEDGMAITGGDIDGGSIDSYRGDHRIAMAFTVAALRAR